MTLSLQHQPTAFLADASQQVAISRQLLVSPYEGPNLVVDFGHQSGDAGNPFESPVTLTPL